MNGPSKRANGAAKKAEKAAKKDVPVEEQDFSGELPRIRQSVGRLNALGASLFSGLGAGSLPTGSAVVSDIIDICRNLFAGVSGKLPMLCAPYLQEVPRIPHSERRGPYYLRFSVSDEPGVLGRIAARIDPGGSRITRLAAAAQVTKQTAGFLVEQLEAAGYVEKVPDPTDGRARLVRLTPRALRVAPIANRAVEQALTEFPNAKAQTREHEPPHDPDDTRGTRAPAVRDEARGPTDGEHGVGERVEGLMARAPRAEPQAAGHGERAHQADGVPVAERLAQAGEALGQEVAVHQSLREEDLEHRQQKPRVGVRPHSDVLERPSAR